MGPKPLPYKMPDLHLNPKAVPYPLGKFDPTITWGMGGAKFDEWAQLDDPWKTADLVNAIRALVTHPGDDCTVWNNMGGMVSEDIINIPQLDVDPSKDSTTMYPPAIIKLLDEIEANYNKPCREMDKLLKAAELQCKRVEGYLVSRSGLRRSKIACKPLN